MVAPALLPPKNTPKDAASTQADRETARKSGATGRTVVPARAMAIPSTKHHVLKISKQKWH